MSLSILKLYYFFMPGISVIDDYVPKAIGSGFDIVELSHVDNCKSVLMIKRKTIELED